MTRAAFFPFVVAALIGLWSLSTGACATEPGVAGSAAIQKTIRRYALTSANDFPQRDPADWRLLGSKDGGTNWTTLDVRRGELFIERHQRRVFDVTNGAPFSIFRLQIDRVRNPSTADSVQLAEIEPLGQTGDELEPAPLPWDLVACQGENLPQETRLEAFDGKLETKWLDHATQNPQTRASWIQWQYCEPGLITNLAGLTPLKSRARHGFQVRIEGTIAGHLPGERVCVLDRSGHFEFAVPQPGRRVNPGERIRAEGITAWANGEVQLLVARVESESTPARNEPIQMAPEQDFPPATEWVWAEVEGRVEFTRSVEGSLLFDLREGGHSMVVRVLRSTNASTVPQAGSKVRVRGLCAGLLNAKGDNVAGALWTASVDEITLLSPATVPTAPSPTEPARTGATATNEPVLTSIEQVRRLSPEQLLLWPRVNVRGVVTELFGGYMQEGPAGIEVWHGNRPPEQIPSFGKFVEIEGRGDWATGHGPIVRADSLRVLGKGKLPAPDRCSWSELASGRMVDQWVEVEGVVRTTDGSHVLLSCEGGQLMATLRSAPAAAVKRLVDATVRIRGVCVAASDPRGRMQGVQLLVPSLEQLEVEQAPADPLSLPTKTIGSLLQVRGPNEFVHRVKVEGILTFREGYSYFIQDQTGAAMAVPAEEVMLDTTPVGSSWMFRQSARTNAASHGDLHLAPGDRVCVVGFPEMRGYSAVLIEVLIRKLPPSEPVAPISPTLDEVLGGGLDSTLVSLEGTLLRQETTGSHLVLELQSGPKVFQALLPAQPKARPSIPAGSRVRVTGVCQVDPVSYTALGKTVSSFRLLVSSPTQIVVLERTPWSDLKRVLVITGVLTVVLALALGWIAILRRQVDQRTKELQREVRKHEETEGRLAAETRRVHEEIEERKRVEAEVERSHKQLLVTSRLAGMAEVATSVLHNVGNVLNSASVLSSLIVEHVRQSKIGSVGKLAHLLGQHRTDLGTYLADAGQGRSLPGYVERLARHLEEEQSRLLEKANSLTESIQHVKEVVAMQQNYAQISGALETVAAAEIIEDALRMHQGAMARHHVRVLRQFEPVPPVTLDRHKLLQILFNLLENARHACDQAPGSEKVVSVGIQAAADDYLEISVADNGVGIPPENLPRLFTQHFSTREGGHGFGLHSSILAAQEIGGTLTAHSSGPGKGAIFTLRLALAATGLPAAHAPSQEPSQPTR